MFDTIRKKKNAKTMIDSGNNIYIYIIMQRDDD